MLQKENAKGGDPVEFTDEFNIPRRDGITQPGLGLMVRPFFSHILYFPILEPGEMMILHKIIS